jgi:Zn-dependent peptidase ImmA (M78 family)
MNFCLAEAEKLALEHESRDPERIAKGMGIAVLRLPLQVVCGMSFSLGKSRLIIVNSKFSEAVQRLIIAHELGHFVLHPQGNFLFILDHTFFYDKHEYQANMFAVALMLGEKMPQEILITELAAGPLDKLLTIFDGGRH